jgi:L-2-hydroxyglutarate oxidase
MHDPGTTRPVDVVVIGGGVVGCATALALQSRPGISVEVLEAEDRVAAHQTGHNSGVIHSGLYYKPGSLKAQNCAAGREALYAFLAERGIPHARCGKLVVATRPDEVPRLDELMARGLANGLQGLRRVGPRELREREPHVAGIAGLVVPDTGVVDYVQVTRAYAAAVVAAGGAVTTGARVTGVRVLPDRVVLETPRGPRAARYVVNCGGLQSDRVARLCGVAPDVRIVPFKGEYYDVTPSRHDLVRALIYPVPDPRFPFLGVHFTRSVHGEVHAGPNAVLAWHREGYRPWSFRWEDARDTLAWPGFVRMAWRFWRMGLSEVARSFSRRLFVRALQRLVPDITLADVTPGVPGIRAQALGRDGALVDDFVIVPGPRSIHVLNAPSPAATASLAIGRSVADLAFTTFDLDGFPQGVSDLGVQRK